MSTTFINPADPQITDSSPSAEQIAEAITARQNKRASIFDGGDSGASGEAAPTRGWVHPVARRREERRKAKPISGSQISELATRVEEAAPAVVVRSFKPVADARQHAVDLIELVYEARAHYDAVASEEAAEDSAIRHAIESSVDDPDVEIPEASDWAAETQRRMVRLARSHGEAKRAVDAFETAVHSITPSDLLPLAEEARKELAKQHKTAVTALSRAQAAASAVEAAQSDLAALAIGAGLRQWSGAGGTFASALTRALSEARQEAEAVDLGDSYWADDTIPDVVLRNLADGNQTAQFVLACIERLAGRHSRNGGYLSVAHQDLLLAQLPDGLPDRGAVAAFVESRGSVRAAHEAIGRRISAATRGTVHDLRTTQLGASGSERITASSEGNESTD
ncbi:hypothetical protein AFL01nite_05220 [Aeromicrobium flavum]|uniref:Uncharacterized protein n=1 Tax=Aeromicrobium flavum TaxID=416568 RepID=A0A512HS26_9ACTN|nr:hypothetical protein [Aeromicrobium flavum]GEO88195.1 hypothetical protein AFL01nite_05220 [Aeromicrobium flavum]